MRGAYTLRRIGLFVNRGICMRSDDPWPVSVIKRWWVRLVCGLKVDFRGPGHELRIGAGGKLQGIAMIYGANNRVVIGERCTFTDIWIDINATESTFAIGDRTRIHGHPKLGCTFLMMKGNKRRFEIGPKCLLSYAIEMRNCDGHCIRDKSTGRLLNPPGDIIIGSHVWIGSYSTILKGTAIGEGTVIGTGSIVSKPVEEDVIAVGRPAKVVRRSVVWDGGLPQNDEADSV